MTDETSSAPAVDGISPLSLDEAASMLGSLPPQEEAPDEVVSAVTEFLARR